MNQDRPKKPLPASPASQRGSSAATVRRAQRHHQERQVARLSAANVEESPHMDRGDSAGGTGESLSHGGPVDDAAAQSVRRGTVDAQYGTKSSMKTGGPSEASPGAGVGPEASKHGDRGRSAPGPDRAEDSSGTGRDTMTTSRPGSGS